MTQAVRVEHDLLGERAVPAGAYYGIHTVRALENFAIPGTSISIYPDLVTALACVKQAAAIANSELGLLEEKRAVAIRLACEEIRERKLHEEFVVDVIQGGAGTSSNMNANEVICNRALEILGHGKGEDEHRLAEAAALIREINLGATAIGTGINAHPDYARIVTQRLSEVSGVPFVTSPNLIEATQDAGAFVQLSGVLKRVAVKLSKTCNDLRLLASGPRAGIGEISLPAMQAGSSIMPGKINPVIPEVVNQIAFEAIGNDITVTLAAEAGQLH